MARREPFQGASSSSPGSGKAKRATPRRSLCQSSVNARAAMRGKLHGAVGNRQPQGCADGAFDQPDVAAMGAHKLRGDSEPKAGTAGAGRALKCLEQMRLRFLRKAGASVGNLDDNDRALATPGDPDLVAAGIAIGAALG